MSWCLYSVSRRMYTWPFYWVAYGQSLFAIIKSCLQKLINLSIKPSVGFRNYIARDGRGHLAIH
jgi:hypothetical protein